MSRMGHTDQSVQCLEWHQQSSLSGVQNGSDRVVCVSPRMAYTDQSMQQIDWSVKHLVLVCLSSRMAQTDQSAKLLLQVCLTQNSLSSSQYKSVWPLKLLKQISLSSSQHHSVSNRIVCIAPCTSLFVPQNWSHRVVCGMQNRLLILTCEDYLDSLIIEEDQRYLQDIEIARQIVKLGYRFRVKKIFFSLPNFFYL